MKSDGKPRYRKVSVRMWGDAKFRALSRPQPNAQTLWIWLLTGPRTIALPGVVVGHLEGLAGELGWPPEQFRERFAELLAQGMVQADWEAGLVYLPKWVKHDAPANPNVLRGRIGVCMELPECDLKQQILNDLHGWSRNRFANRSETDSKQTRNRPEPQYQDQDQDQDQEKKEPPIVPRKRGTVVGRNGTPDYGSDHGFMEFWGIYPNHSGKAEAFKMWRQVKPPIAEVLEALKWQTQTPDFTPRPDHTVLYAVRYIKRRRWEDPKPVENRPKLQPIHAAMKPATTEEIMEMRRKREEWEAREKERIKGGQDAKSRG